MKNKLNNFLLALSFIILLTISVYGQRDTIKYYPYVLQAAIKDSNAYPIGLKDSFVITKRSELDTIYKIYKVYKFEKISSAYDSLCNHGINKVYKIFCNCNEYQLLDTLIKFNIYNKNDFICYAGQILRNNDNIQDQKENNKYHIYPNPVTDILNIKAPFDKTIKIEVFNTYGSLISSAENITNTFRLNMTGEKPRLYIIKINSGTECKFFKVIKN